MIAKTNGRIEIDLKYCEESLACSDIWTDAAALSSYFIRVDLHSLKHLVQLLLILADADAHD